MFDFIEEAKQESALALASEDKDLLMESTSTGVEMTQTLELVLVELQERSEIAQYALDHKESVDRRAEQLKDIEIYEQVINLVEESPNIA